MPVFERCSLAAADLIDEKLRVSVISKQTRRFLLQISVFRFRFSVFGIGFSGFGFGFLASTRKSIYNTGSRKTGRARTQRTNCQTDKLPTRQTAG